MLLSRHRLIFLHLPKTGGNAVSDYLLPHSDDTRTLIGHQDGIDRFEVRGPVTPHKHATLADYRTALGDEALGGYRVAIGTRDPVERALSLYFSPHRWYRETAEGWVRDTPHWDVAAFAVVVRDMASMADMLRAGEGGAVRRPDFTLRHSALEMDLAAMARALEMPSPPPLVRRNASTIDAADRARLSGDPDVRATVSARLAEDYALLADWGLR